MERHINIWHTAKIGAYLLIVLGVAVFSGVSRASAATTTDRPLLFSFDGSDTTAGRFKALRGIAVDETTGAVYVSDLGRSVVSKFNAEGEAEVFSTTGKSSLDGSDTPQKEFGNDGGAGPYGIAVDDHGGNLHNIYIEVRDSGGVGKVLAYDQTGQYLWQLPFGAAGHSCGIAVDLTGHLWVADRDAERMREFANTGSPPIEIQSISVPGLAGPCGLDFDSLGNAYTGKGSGGGQHEIAKYAGSKLSKIIDASNSQGVTVDQSNPLGHIFTLHSGGAGFNEYDASGTLIGGFGAKIFYEGEGIAYNPILDRVYVARGETVDVLGPVASGTAPDVIAEDASNVEISSAALHGKINPQGEASSYFFQWVGGTANNWDSAKSSTPQALPIDSTSHSVSADIDELSGGRTYQARLVGVNVNTKLREVSPPIEFTTLKAASPPGVSIGPPDNITASFAIAHGTVDPQKDYGTKYWFETSTDPACKTGFVARPRQDLKSAADNPVPVEEKMDGLFSSQHYCVRLAASNSASEEASISEIEEFTTLANPPSEASTAFAAPRLDTSARLNARVNPEGAPLDYAFEWSADAGETWNQLPELENRSAAREQIIVSEELTGLIPGTTYYYRLDSAKNKAGAAALSEEVKTFTTRTREEVALPPNVFEQDKRGIELVNSPDKGNQHARTEVVQGTLPISPDGSKAIWNVLGGAPGGNTGTGATFLAERTPQGWLSRSVVPPAAAQAEGADIGGYKLGATTPDLSAFVFNAGSRAVSPGHAVVRTDQNQHEVLLGQFSKELHVERVDMTDDGAHILFVNPDSEQLEDLGTSPPETISVMQNELPNECGLVSADVNRSFVGGGGGGEAAAKQWRPGYHMIATTDASRVYFQAKPNICGSKGLYGIYERNREAGKTTTLVDPGFEGRSPQFIRATPDGREAYFLTFSNHSTYSLIDPEGKDTNAHADVYRWSEEEGASVCLTCGAENKDGELVADANVRFLGSGEANGGHVLVSDDFSHIYFESTSQLVPGQGKAGAINVYSLNEGKIRAVADVSAADGILGGSSILSRDGDVLVFVASGTPEAFAGLTSDALAPSCNGSATCRELMRYDDRDSSLECVSCQRDAATESSVGSPFNAQGDFGASADGNTIAFVTAEPLVPADVNHSVDIYEWRNSVVRLLSDGVTTYPLAPVASPQVHAVDADGSDIFFSLIAPDLTGFEHDQFANLYDARIGGGFVSPSPPRVCSGESCQGPLQAAPGFERPGSLFFVGRGNAKPPPAHQCARKRGSAKKRCLHSHKKHGSRKQGHSKRRTPR